MKKFILTFAIVLSSFFLMENVEAKSATISITSNTNKVVVGNTFNVTVTVSSGSPFAYCEFALNYDSGSATLQSGDAHPFWVLQTTNGEKTRLSYSYTFKAKKAGNFSVSLVSVKIADISENEYSYNSSASKTISVMTQSQLEATYSKNNNLSSLSINGAELSPAFNPDVTDYTIELQPGTEQINVSATKADTSASILGTGVINVSDGLNTIKIEVTAQNGNIKTYTINATVLELDPINVNVDGVDYSIVRKAKNISFDNKLFALTTTTYKGEEIPAFFNEKINLTLIALKDADGNVKMFSIDGDNISQYQELKTSGIILYIKNKDEVPFGYTKATININDVEYQGYKFKDTSRFALVYGINEENGNEGYYVYDNFENTLQRYDTETASTLENRIKKFQLLTTVLACSSGCLLILLISFLIVSNKNRKKIKVNKKIENKVEELKDNIDPDDNLKEINLSKTHDLKLDLENAKDRLNDNESVDEINSDSSEKDIFDEMDETTLNDSLKKEQTKDEKTHLIEQDRHNKKKKRKSK